jgi:hypothetical protein
MTLNYRHISICQSFKHQGKKTSEKILNKEITTKGQETILSTKVILGAPT